MDKRHAVLAGIVMATMFCLTQRVWGAAMEKSVQVTVEAIKPDALYAVGEQATFKISVIDPDGKPVQTGTVHVALSVESGPEIEKKDLPLGAGPMQISGTLTEPGFLRCEASYEAGGKTASGLAMAGFDPTQIQPVTQMPDDFDAFWEQSRKEAAQIPLDMKLELLAKYSDEEVDSYKFSFANIENTRLEGYLCVPKDKPGPFPAFVEVPSSGTGKPEKPWPEWARKGALVMCIEVHPLTLVPEKPQKDYEAELEKMYPNYSSYGLPDRNKYYFRRAVVGIDRGLSWLAARPDFDGRHLVVYGSSQGGWFAFVMSAINPRVTAFAANVPGLCDAARSIRRAQSVGKLTPEQARQYVETYAYYDSVNFARRVPAAVPAIVSVGFLDTACSPPGVYAAFNTLPRHTEVGQAGPKRIFPMIRTGHGMSDEFEQLINEWVAGQLGLAKMVEPSNP